MSIDTSVYVTATVSQWRGRLILLKGHGRGAATGGSSCSAEEQVQKRGYIVIVETDDLIRDLLERWLGEAGYAVVATAADVAVQERPVRLVIVIISSPRGVDGLIQSLQASYMAPILVISARLRRGLEGSADVARQLGVRKVLPKPFTRMGLLVAVRESIQDS